MCLSKWTKYSQSILLLFLVSVNFLTMGICFLMMQFFRDTLYVLTLASYACTKIRKVILHKSEVLRIYFLIDWPAIKFYQIAAQMNVIVVISIKWKIHKIVVVTFHLKSISRNVAKCFNRSRCWPANSISCFSWFGDMQMISINIAK